MTLQERVVGLHRELDALAAAAAREQGEFLRGLQLAGRALRQAESTEQWVQMLADAAAPFAGHVQFYRVEGDAVRCEAARGAALLVEGEIALAEAPAFRQAVETRETVVALGVPSQLSRAGEVGARRRIHLLPLVGKTRVLGILAAADAAEWALYGLEVLVSLGAASLELRSAKGTSSLIGVAAPASVPAAAPSLGPATAGSFARSTVAGWVLDQSELVARGRAAGDLYGALRGPIDEARRTFVTRYGGAEDLLHREMVSRLALGNAQLLGAGYPGPLDGPSGGTRRG